MSSVDFPSSRNFVYSPIKPPCSFNYEEIPMYDIMIQQMKMEVTRHGVRELQTPREVQNVIDNSKGTVLVFVNSVCGCAGGIARPALGIALQHHTKPDVVATVFATTDREATAAAREYFTDQPPSSPSFALLRDRKLVAMVHRSDIKRSSPEQTAALLTSLFDRHCSTAATH
jgi:putative YphP/YqiW family bacilliredoxin